LQTNPPLATQAGVVVGHAPGGTVMHGWHETTGITVTHG